VNRQDLLKKCAQISAQLGAVYGEEMPIQGVVVKAPHGWEQIAPYYSWSSFNGDVADWERDQMVLVPAPIGARFFYDKNVNGVADPGEQSRGVRVHSKIALETADALAAILKAGLWEHVSSCAGGFAWRNQRGSTTKISMHSLGAAVDFDPRRNGLGKPPKETNLGTRGYGVVKLMEERGWTWGGRWGRPDCMHFQWGGGY
jgi:hypothetical protein